MKIDIDKLTKQMFERLHCRPQYDLENEDSDEILGYGYSKVPLPGSSDSMNEQFVSYKLALQIALDEEIEKVKYGQDLLTWSLGGVDNKENAEIIHNKIRKLDRQLAGLNRLKEEL